MDPGSKAGVTECLSAGGYHRLLYRCFTPTGK